MINHYGNSDLALELAARITQLLTKVAFTEAVFEPGIEKGETHVSPS